VSLADARRAKLAALATRRSFKIAIAIAFAVAHLLVVDCAGHKRLDLPFNNAPGVHLAFSDPMANSLGSIPREPANWSRLVMSRFDSQHYIGFALRGLSACPPNPPTRNAGWGYLHCGLGWLPAYGVAGGVVSSVTGVEPDVALVLISVLCAIIVNWLWICPTMIRKLGLFEAYAVLLAWNCYAGAWNMVVPTTEPVVLALALGGFVMLANERWIWAGVLIGACTSLRIPTASYAMALGCALLYAAWQRYKANTPQWWRPLVAVPLCGWGQFATMAVFQAKLHNWHAFFDARFAFGDKNRLERLFDVQYFVRGFQSQCADMVIYLGLISIMVLTWKPVLAKLGKPERMFVIVATVITTVLAVAAAFQYWGLTRYMMLCPLPFLCMGAFAKQHRAAFVLWLLLGCAVYWHFELCSYMTQGSPIACPCLGKLELSMPW
jgi:hypothetical protein